MLLRVVFADEALIARYEVMEEDGSYRTWCVPASIINAHAAVEREVEDEDDEELRRLRALAQQRLRNIRSRRPVR